MEVGLTRRAVGKKRWLIERFSLVHVSPSMVVVYGVVGTRRPSLYIQLGQTSLVGSTRGKFPAKFHCAEAEDEELAQE